MTVLVGGTWIVVPSAANGGGGIFSYNWQSRSRQRIWRRSTPICTTIQIQIRHVCAQSWLFSSICNATIFNTPWLVVIISNMTCLMTNRTKVGQSWRVWRLRSRHGVGQCGGILWARCRCGIRIHRIHDARTQGLERTTVEFNKVDMIDNRLERWKVSRWLGSW